MSHTTYALHLRDDCGGDREQVTIAAGTDEEVIREVRDTIADHASDYCRAGDWGDDGASVVVDWSLVRTDADGTATEIASGSETVEIEPDHAELIEEATHGREHCGTDPADHDWTREGEGGCRDNPGVWSSGGTSLRISSHCRRCGLHRIEHLTGAQRNPGECDTVEYLGGSNE